MKKIGIILGTRPEAIKLIPVYKQLLLSKKILPILISTGQHKEMLNHTLSFFNIKPDYDMRIMKAGQTLASSTALIIEKTQKVIDRHKFDLIMVQGDTTTAFAAALSAYYKKIPVAHVEAGLRTHDIYSPFPEEINRKLISSIAEINFAPTQNAVKNLQQEKSKNIYLVGNTIVDAALLCLKKIKGEEILYKNYFKHKIGNYPHYCLITGHRRESFGKGLINICKAIKILASKYSEVGFIYPIHLNPNVKKVVSSNLKRIKNVHLLNAQPYDDLIYLMSKSRIILTDSGGIQEEAPTFNVPVIVMREKTERKEGVEAGCAIVAGTSTEGIVKSFNNVMSKDNLYKKMANTKNPYGDGKASQKIVRILESFFFIFIVF